MDEDEMQRRFDFFCSLNASGPSNNYQSDRWSTKSNESDPSDTYRSDAWSTISNAAGPSNTHGSDAWSMIMQDQETEVIPGVRIPLPSTFSLLGFLARPTLDRAAGPQNYPENRSHKVGNGDKNELKMTQLNDLNDDCLLHIFTFLPIIDRVRAQRVCKRWREVSLDSWRTLKRFNMSDGFWGVRRGSRVHVDRPAFRKVLELCGPYLKHIDMSRKITAFSEKIHLKANRAALEIVTDNCPNIQTMHAGSPNSEAAIDLIASHLQLTRLEIKILRSDYLLALEDLLASQKSLSYLRIKHSKLSCDSIRTIYSPSIRELHLIYCSFEPSKYVGSALSRLKKLKTLSLVYCYSSIEWERRALQAISTLRDLVNLDVRLSNSVYASAEVDFLKNLVHLENVCIGGCDIATDEVMARVGHRCTKIKNLRIMDSDCATDKTISYLASLPHLEYLYFERLSNLTCANLEKISQVKRLECKSCPDMKYDGFINLIATSKNINSIKIDDCRGVSTELITNSKKVASETLEVSLNNSNIEGYYNNQVFLYKIENKIIKTYAMTCAICYKRPIRNCPYCSCKAVVI